MALNSKRKVGFFNARRLFRSIPLLFFDNSHCKAVKRVAVVKVGGPLRLSRASGFTLIEAMIVIAIIAILVVIAIPAYRSYVIRTEVDAGIQMAGSAKVAVSEYYASTGVVPTNRSEAGLSPNASITTRYTTNTAVINGRITVTYGNEAAQVLSNQTISLTPYETNAGVLVWRCGNAPAPTGLALAGTGGGQSATYQASTIDNRYLPHVCQP